MAQMYILGVLFMSALVVAEPDKFPVLKKCLEKEGFCKEMDFNDPDFPKHAMWALVNKFDENNLFTSNGSIDKDLAIAGIVKEQGDEFIEKKLKEIHGCVQEAENKGERGEKAFEFAKCFERKVPDSNANPLKTCLEDEEDDNSEDDFQKPDFPRTEMCNLGCKFDQEDMFKLDGTIDKVAILKKIEEEIHTPLKGSMLKDIDGCLRKAEEIRLRCEKTFVFVKCIEEQVLHPVAFALKKCQEKENYIGTMELNFDERDIDRYTREAKCVLACLYIKDEQDGSIDKEVAVAVLEEEKQDSLKFNQLKSVDYCLNEAEKVTERCDKAFQFQKCLQENVVSNFEGEIDPFEKCLEKRGYDMKTIFNLDDPDFPYEKKCTLACILEFQELVKPDGSIQEEVAVAVIKRKLGDELPNTLLEKINDCVLKAEVVEDKCEKTMQFIQCTDAQDKRIWRAYTSVLNFKLML